MIYLLKFDRCQVPAAPGAVPNAPGFGAENCIFDLTTSFALCQYEKPVFLIYSPLPSVFAPFCPVSGECSRFISYFFLRAFFPPSAEPAIPRQIVNLNRTSVYNLPRPFPSSETAARSNAFLDRFANRGGSGDLPIQATGTESKRLNMKDRREQFRTVPPIQLFSFFPAAGRSCRLSLPADGIPLAVAADLFPPSGFRQDVFPHAAAQLPPGNDAPGGKAAGRKAGGVVPRGLFLRFAHAAPVVRAFRADAVGPVHETDAGVRVRGEFPLHVRHPRDKFGAVSLSDKKGKTQRMMRAHRIYGAFRGYAGHNFKREPPRPAPFNWTALSPRAERRAARAGSACRTRSRAAPKRRRQPRFSARRRSGTGRRRASGIPKAPAS